MPMKLRLMMEKLQKGLSLLATTKSLQDDIVKEGHFVVFAVKGKEAKRFVLKLESLNNPAFLKLLELAKEEYGFHQKGALEVPCKPNDLYEILENKREKKTSNRVSYL